MNGKRHGIAGEISDLSGGGRSSARRTNETDATGLSLGNPIVPAPAPAKENIKTI